MVCQKKRVNITAYSSGQAVRAYVTGLLTRIATNKQTDGPPITDCTLTNKQTDGPPITDCTLYFSTCATYFGFA